MFAGPTLARARIMRPGLSLAAVHVAPPIRRGDLPRLVAAVGPPSAIAIVDGVFHQALAVGHIEIRDAMAAGWEVWGLSSMGAIRAREMRHLGLRGFGRVYDMYGAADRDMRDDEVTLLHDPHPPYREASEPLVHLRAALVDLGDRGLILPADAAAIADALDEMYFGDRTLATFRALVAARAPQALAELADIDRHRIKALDLIDFLEQRPFQRRAEV